MKYRYDTPGQHEDPQVQDFVDRTKLHAQAVEGDLVGPFDHPEGIGADEPFDVSHDLEAPAASFAVEDPGYTGAGVYATSEDRERWNDKTITLRSPDPSNKAIRVRVRRAFDDA